MARPVALPTITNDSALGGTVIENSLRFDYIRQTTLTRTPSSPGNYNTFTLSFWMKRTHMGVWLPIIGAWNTGNVAGTLNYIAFSDDDKLTFANYNASVFGVRSDIKIRDANSWYHCVVAVDTLQSTAADRVKFYVNGTETGYSVTGYPPQYTDFTFNQQLQHVIGYNNYYRFYGYLANIHFVDGQQLDASAFGYTDEQTGIWRPKAYSPHPSPNNGTTWSNHLTVSSGSINNAANAFNTDVLSFNVSSVDEAVITFTPPGGIPFKESVRIWLRTSGHKARLNGGTYVFNTGAPTVGQWMYLANGTSGTISTIDVQYTGGSLSAINAIEVDGHILINGLNDINGYGTQGYELRFEDDSNVTATTLGSDTSGRGNNFTPSGFSVDTELVTNGEFSSDSNWDKDGSWSISGGKASNSGAGQIYQTISVVSGITYLMTATLDFTADSSVNNTSIGFRATDNSQYYAQQTGASGIFNPSAVNQVHVRWTSNITGNVRARCYSTDTITIDNWSVKALKDTLPDSPTKSNKIAHLNRNLGNYNTDTRYDEGAYRFYYASSNQRQTRSNLSVKSGKWYAEIKLGAYTNRSGSYPYIGAGPNNTYHQSWVGSRNIAYNTAGYVYYPGYSQGGFPTYGSNDLISVAIDLDQSPAKIWWAKNGVYINSGNPASNSNGYNIPTSYTDYYDFIISMYAQSGATYDCNFGQREFVYTPPTGFEPLRKDKITITPSITRAKKHFDVVTWTSDARTSDRTIPLEFRPALVWTKCYSGDAYHNALFNTNTGPNANLVSDEAFAENSANGGRLREFDSKGFTWRYGAGSNNQWWNEGSYKYVAWCWKGGEPDVPISGSVYFDGSSDYMSLGMDGSSADLGMGTGDFTVECWVKKDRQEHRGIWQISGTVGGLQSTNYKDTLALGYQSGVWQTYGGSGAGDDHETSSYPIEPDRWYHTAVCRSSGTTKLFIDGQQVLSYADNKDYGSARYMAVGGYYNTSYLHRGSISNLNVIKGTALYTSNFTPPTEPLTAHANTKFLLCQSNNAPGDSTVHKGTATNAYNRTQWSHYLTGGGGFQGSYPASNAFNGTTTGSSTSRSTNSQTTQTFTPPGGISYSSSVEVWTWMDGTVSLNGGSNITVSNDQSFRTIATGSGTIDYITFNSASGNSVYIAGIRVDGNILIEPQGVTVNDNTRAENCNPFEAFSVDGVGYPTAALAGLTGGSSPISRATVNTKAGFSLITKKGTGSNTSFPHGLGVTPNIVFYKNREGGNNWGFTGNIGELVYGTNKMTIQAATAIAADTNETLSSTNATLVHVGNSGAANGTNNTTNYYCFAEKPGFSKFGTYYGDGVNDGPYVWCGFRPAMIVVKNTDAGHNWRVHDRLRHGGNGVSAHHLEWSTSATQYSNYDLDFLGNGFKIRTNSTYVNNSSNTYFFMAFAEQVGTTPFETEANAG